MASSTTGPTQAQVYFGTAEHGWMLLAVASYQGHEELSKLYRYDLTLIVRGQLEPLDLDAMLNLPATLAIRTENALAPGARDHHPSGAGGPYRDASAL